MPIGITNAQTQIDNRSTRPGADGHFVLSDGSVGMDAALQMKGNKIENLATPTVGTDAVNKDYVDSAVAAAGGERVKVSANDSTADYLINKLVAGTNITLTEVGDGGNETFRLDASGGGGGGVSLRDYAFTSSKPVPNQGTQYLFIGSISSLASPLPVNKDSTLISAAVLVDELDATNGYDLEILVNGTVEATISLVSGDTYESDTFAVSLTAGDQIVVRMVRTSGSGKSDFNSITATVEIQEV